MTTNKNTKEVPEVKEQKVAQKKPQLTMKQLEETLKQVTDKLKQMENVTNRLTDTETETQDYIDKIRKDTDTNTVSINTDISTNRKAISALRNSIDKINARIQTLEHPKATVIEIKAEDNNISLITPTPSKDGSIGDDLMTVEDIWVHHGRNVIPTNICINLPRGIEAKIEPRSGFSVKGIWGVHIQKACSKIFGIFRRPAVEVEVEGYMDADVINGKIDPGYRNGIGIIIKNHGVPFCIPANTRIAQITYYKTVPHRYKHVEEFSNDEPFVVNREGGFGSSGK